MHFAQRKRLSIVGIFEFRQPINEVDDCDIADVLFIRQIYNVKPELKHNKELLRQCSSSPNNSKLNFEPTPTVSTIVAYKKLYLVDLKLWK